MLRKGNLLIVDDNLALLEVLKDELSPLADQVFLAHDGYEAIRRLSNDSIHCIVCDYDMPRMNGMEVLRIVRSRGQQLPFIFYTGQDSYPLIVEAARYKAFALLHKPDQERLAQIVSQGLNLGLSEWQKNPSYVV